MITTDLLPPPTALGFTTRYPAWRPGQSNAVWHLGANPDGVRTTGFQKPTGAGKSLTAAAYSVLTGKRVVILTHSKALQSQYMQTVAQALPASVATMTDIRGKGSYRCNVEMARTPEDAPCTLGARCPIKWTSCSYYTALRRAQDSQIVVTNYTKWMTEEEYGQGLSRSLTDDEGNVTEKPFDAIICDEADVLFGAVSSFLTTEVTAIELKELGDGWGLPLELPDQDLDGKVEPDWAGIADAIRDWATPIADLVAARLEMIEERIDEARRKGAILGVDTVAERKKYRDLNRRFQLLSTLHGRWVYEWGGRRVSLKLQPVWPAEYLEDYVLRGIPRVILMSATLTLKTMELLGFRDDDPTWEFLSYPSQIPPSRRPITHVKTVDMSKSRANYGVWINKLDNAIHMRRDRKILIQTTSYDRRTAFMLGSRFKDSGILLSHDRHNTERVVADFKTRKTPVVLVSPSVVRGFDFPDDECRAIFIGKVPWPSPDPVTKARRLIDRDYGAYEAMQAIQQEAGRGTRHPGDWCEILIFDDAWAWFWPRYRHFAADWFQEAVGRSVSSIPPPPPLDRGPPM